MRFSFLHIYLLAMFAIALAACNKNTSDELTSPVTTYLDVVDATDNTFNVYQNGTRLNSTSNIYVGGSSGYLSVLAGKQSYSFKPPYNAQALQGTDTTFSKTLTLEGGEHYSLFVAGNTAAKAFLVKDSIIVSSATDTATARFVHAAPSFGAVDITLNDTKYYTNKSYDSATSFINIPGDVSTIIKVYLTGTSTLLASATVTPGSNDAYTIFIKDTKVTTNVNGVANTTTTAGIGFVTNQ